MSIYTKQQETLKFHATWRDTMRHTDRVASNLVAGCRATRKSLFVQTDLQDVLRNPRSQVTYAWARGLSIEPDPRVSYVIIFFSPTSRTLNMLDRRTPHVGHFLGGGARGRGERQSKWSVSIKNVVVLFRRNEAENVFVDIPEATNGYCRSKVNDFRSHLSLSSEGGPVL
jgi:hypothetical protein